MDITSYLLGKNASGGGGGGLDWSAIGYDSTPQSVVDDYNYSKQIQNEWIPSDNLNGKFYGNKDLVFMPLVDTSIAINMYGMFNSCSNLTSIPQLDTSNVLTMQSTFESCSNLISVPQLDTSKITNMSNTFKNCTVLSDESLNNILQMCINATSYNTTKTLYQLGLRSSNYPVSRIEALPSYQAFLNAGWTIGY